MSQLFGGNSSSTFQKDGKRFLCVSSVHMENGKSCGLQIHFGSLIKCYAKYIYASFTITIVKHESPMNRNGNKEKKTYDAGIVPNSLNFAKCRARLTFHICSSEMKIEMIEIVPMP